MSRFACVCKLLWKLHRFIRLMNEHKYCMTSRERERKMLSMNGNVSNFEWNGWLNRFVEQNSWNKASQVKKSMAIDENHAKRCDCRDFKPWADDVQYNKKYANASATGKFTESIIYSVLVELSCAVLCWWWWWCNTATVSLRYGISCCRVAHAVFLIHAKLIVFALGNSTVIWLEISCGKHAYTHTQRASI